MAPHPLRLGYCFKNISLNTHSGLAMPTSKQSEAPSEAASRFSRNIESLRGILSWNSTRNIGLFRLSENWLPPILYEMQFRFLLESYAVQLQTIQNSYLFRFKQRLTIHAPCSSNWAFSNSKFLQCVHRCAFVFQLLNHKEGVIECHLGHMPPKIWRVSDKLKFLDGVINTINLLPIEVKQHLYFENDKTWDPDDVLYVCERTGCKMIYDILHHQLWPGSVPFNEETIDKVVATTFQQCAIDSQFPAPPLYHISSQHPVREEGCHDDAVQWTDYLRLKSSLYRCKIRAADILFEAGSCEQAVLSTRTELARYVKVNNSDIYPLGQENQ